jgi:hypothetical protein
MVGILSPKWYLYLNFLRCYSFDMSRNKKDDQEKNHKKTMVMDFCYYNTS